METGHSAVQLDFAQRDAGERARAVQKVNAPAWWSGTAPGADYRLIEPLTERELHFLDCLANGISNKEIARSLSVSENTVKFHLKNVYSKFAVRTRVQAIRAAYELGVLAPPANEDRAITGAMS